MNKDQLILEQMYSQMYDEGFLANKAKKFGRNVGIAGIATLGAMGTMNKINDRPLTHGMGPDKMSDASKGFVNFKDSTKVEGLVNQYLQEHDYNIISPAKINGDQLTFETEQLGQSSLSLHTLKTKAQISRTLEKGQDNLAGFLGSHL